MLPLSKKRGRKAKLVLEDQITVYQTFSREILDENGKIKPATAEIFHTLSKKLEMTNKAIQISVVKNAEAIFGSNYKKTAKENEHEENSDCEDEETYFKDLSGLSIEICLSEIE